MVRVWMPYGGVRSDDVFTRYGVSTLEFYRRTARILSREAATSDDSYDARTARIWLLHRYCTAQVAAIRREVRTGGLAGSDSGSPDSASVATAVDPLRHRHRRTEVGERASRSQPTGAD